MTTTDLKVGTYLRRRNINRYGKVVQRIDAEENWYVVLSPVQETKCNEGCDAWDICRGVNDHYQCFNAYQCDVVPKLLGLLRVGS